MEALGGGSVSYERGIPAFPRLTSCGVVCAGAYDQRVMVFVRAEDGNEWQRACKLQVLLLAIEI